MLSTQFLAQPFVWLNWPVDAVLEGWLHILADRLLVAAPIGLCVWASSHTGARTALAQAPRLGIAVTLGAVLGEILRVRLDPFGDRPDAVAALGRIAQWILISAAGVGIMALWRLNADYATTSAEASAAEARARRMLLASELDVLQRQIEPHFLFNTLATIKRFGETAPNDAVALLERLFDYLSRTFAVSGAQVSTLGPELDLVAAYLDVCSVRMGSRLRVVWAIDPALRACSLPPLMLGTLVENAIQHGLSPAPAGGVIALRARVVEQDLEICVEDDGVGLQGDGGAGIGLANLAARLELLYGDRGTLQLQDVEPHGVRAVVRLPYAPAG